MPRGRGSCRFFAVSLALLALSIATPSVRAQAVYGSIAGNVVDSTGAAVPGATVTITSVGRKAADTVVTNNAGFYEKGRLLPGTYDVRVELAGFKAKVVSAVTVNVDSQTNVDLALELGAMTETVTVESVQSQLLKTDRADVATTFDTKLLTELPNIDRNFTKAILLTPGTQRLTGWNHAASENPQGSQQTMVNGQHFSGTGYQLDGTENRDVILGIIVINPNLEAVAESKITSQNYDAEFGQATAGVVSVQTKSGANQFHGSAFEFHSSDKFQSRDPFSQPDRVNPLTGRVLPETKRDQFGASLGGPILKDKLFFFGDYQGLRSTIGGSRLLSVPTALARSGNFSEYGVNIYDPLTGQPFPGNIIPTSRLSPPALAILNLIPGPNATGSVNGTRDNYTASGSEKFDSDAFNVRSDARLSTKANVFGRYSQQKFTLEGPTALGQGGGAELVTLGGASKVNNRSLALGLDYVLSPTTVFDVRFGWFNYKVDVLPFDFGTTPMTTAGAPGLNISGDSFTSGLSGIFLRGNQADMNWGSGLGVNRCNCPLAEDESQWQIVSNLTKVLGNHSVKFGGDLRRAHNLRVPSDAHRAGELTFEAERTGSPTAGGGLGLATFMLGDVTEFSRYVSSSTDARESQWRWFVYVQDTWRASSKLTLNYGLRLESINPESVNAAGNGGWADLATGQMLVGGVGDVNLQGNVQNKINWAPRLGITYQINPKTVIRMGYGRSYDIGVFGSTFGHGVTQNLPVLGRQNLNRPTQFSSVFNLAEGPAPLGFPQPDASGRFTIPDGVAVRVRVSPQRLPYVDSWNFTVQREVTSTLSAEVGYVGNKGTHVFFGDGPTVNANEPTIDGFAQGVPTNQRRPFYAGPIDGFGGAFGWTSGDDYFCNCADNHYDSLQAKVNKRFSGSYSLFLTYTLQRVRQYGGGQAFFDRSIDYGRPGWARTHLFSLANSWELPFGHGKRWGGDASGLKNAFIGGWQLNFVGYHVQRRAVRRQLSERVPRPRRGPEPAEPDRRPGRGPGRRDHQPLLQRDARRCQRQPVGQARRGHLRELRPQRPRRPLVLERERLGIQEVQRGRSGQPGAPPGGPEPLQPREPLHSERGGRHAHQPEPQRRIHHTNRPGLAAAQPAVRRALPVLTT